MKKEITFESDKFRMHFFYDDRSINEVQVRKLKAWNQVLLKALTDFSFKGILKEVLKRRNIQTLVLNFNLVGDAKIKKLNLEYRGKNKITDVLSFPMQDDIRCGEFDFFSPELELGDLFICKSVCEKQAREFNLSFEEEFVHLATHGFLHLIGFDHEISDEEEKIMEGFEEKIIKLISKLIKK